MILRIFFIFIFWQSQGFAKDVLIPTDYIITNEFSKYYLISIGINDYEDDFWPSLKWPSKDANRVSNMFGIDTKNIIQKTILLNETANLQSVKNTLVNIAKLASYNDKVILYLSGHGTLALNDDGDLSRIVVLYDTQKNNLRQTGISHQWLRQWLSTLKANKKMIIFATCNSGVGKSRIPSSIEQLLASKKGKLIPLEDVSEGALILAAAAKGEAAHEDDNLEGDIYTHFLLEALELYDRNRDGMVSALEAHDYAREKTWTFTRGKQRPTADIELIGNADIPLAGRKLRSPLPILEAYDEELAGFRVQIDGKEKGKLPLAFPLNPGRSKVTLYPPNTDEALANYVVSINKGESVSLEEIINNRPIALTTGLLLNNWSDSAWEKLLGSRTSTDFFINAIFQSKHFGMGAEYMRSVFYNESNLRLNLDSEVDYYSLNLNLFAKTFWRSLTFQITGQIGYEFLEVKVIDKINNDSLTFSDSSLKQSIRFRVAKEVYPQLYASLSAGKSYSDFHLEKINELSGDRITIGIALNYVFHWNYSKI